MAFDSLLGNHPHLSEQYKYQILLERLKHPPAYQLARAHIHHPQPYTSAMHALTSRYGQPRHLIQSEIARILNSASVKANDGAAFEEFALAVQSLVGLLISIEGRDGTEVKARARRLSHNTTFAAEWDRREKFAKLTVEERRSWIRENRRCWKCCRTHPPEACTLKRPCGVCSQLHLTILHDTLTPAGQSCLMPQRWGLGPPFLFHDQTHWPQCPVKGKEEDLNEVKTNRLLLLSTQTMPHAIDISTCTTWTEAIAAAVQVLDSTSDVNSVSIPCSPQLTLRSICLSYTPFGLGHLLVFSAADSRCSGCAAL
uniref:Uncharacterized protein n=1 Tax=Knipowitschia caucasica TaxID=637954 RepID=A0AAV2MBC1_KNICA